MFLEGLQTIFQKIEKSGNSRNLPVEHEIGDASDPDELLSSTRRRVSNPGWSNSLFRESASACFFRPSEQ
ncbi:hypothetical protein PIIN_11097 [Serendipita indica DSM 11827]|uniref:Uncharacterized protein n=1 Tax=Serendipita indica (strain DSM 11827) TaxID=1109443 RepID=G4U0M1_SERID|nr:hypothetical protein PIIN_11097 [Serendipita indica DSM 11827]